MLALGFTVLAGPPHMTVRTMPLSSNTAFELDVEHHTEPEQMAVTGRAEGLRNGTRVSVPLTITRKDAAHFSVTRQWDRNAAWVLVFSAEQGPQGQHGVVEAVVSIEANGTIRGVEYIKPEVRKDGKPLAATTLKVNQALQSLGLTTASK
jgi:hypothetical protein